MASTHMVAGTGIFYAGHFKSPQHLARQQKMLDVILKKFDQPDEVVTFEKGRFELLEIGGLTIGKATYQPGWKWSEHVGPGIGEKICPLEHVGMVLAGCAVAAFEDGRVIEMTAGHLFHIPAEPHDSWVIGDEEYVSLHFLNPQEYAK